MQYPFVRGIPSFFYTDQLSVGGNARRSIEIITGTRFKSLANAGTGPRAQTKYIHTQHFSGTTCVWWKSRPGLGPESMRDWDRHECRRHRSIYKMKEVILYPRGRSRKRKLVTNIKAIN
ncbi:hypothetical protein EVAR_9476_1 [Eumeta japonica]|uniref:Uncharacterized protein n=1 Tax=Eumeta variegata TaxID=151549 RepID=A0A4C2A0X0_EUMVA|nr:hypothetical protein EVAR_9476_1 [Eumeta japonica]